MRVDITMALLIGLSIILMLCPTYAVSITEQGKIIQRGNYGVLFRPVNEIRGAEQFWRHSFELKLPSSIQMQIDVPSCADVEASNTSCVQLQHIFQVVKMMHTSCMANVNKTMEKIGRLIPEYIPRTSGSPNSRSKRALLDFGGDIFHSLFGVARTKDLMTLQSHIKQIASAVNTINHDFTEHTSEMSSIMTATNDRVDMAVRAITDNHNQLDQLSEEMRLLLDATDVWWKGLFIISDYQDKVTHINNHLADILQGTYELLQKRLSPALISAELLTNTLKKVQSVLSRNHPGFYVIYSDPEFYYQNAVSAYLRRDNSIFITINIPVQSGYHKYLIHEVIAMPVPVNATTKHATMVLNLPDYIGVDIQGVNFIEMQNQDLKYCKGSYEKLCSNLIAERSTANPSCALAILYNRKESVKDLCEFGFTKNSLKTSLMEVEPGKILVSNIQNVIINCNGQLDTRITHNYCLMTIPCECSVSAGPFTLPSRLDRCQNSSGTVTMSHLINLAVLQNFFDETDLKHIMGDTTFEDPIETVLPKFDIFSHNFSDAVSLASDAQLNLKHMVERMKNKKPIYSSLSESLLGGEWLREDSFDWLNWRNLVSFASIGLSIFSLFLILAFGTKLRALKISILALQSAHLVDGADSSKNFVYLQPDDQDSITSIPEPINLVLTFDIGIYCAIGATLLTFLLIAFLCRKWRSRSHSSVYLEITSGKRCMKFLVLRINECPKFLHFRASEQFDSLSIVKGLQPKLKCNWHDLRISTFNSNISFVPPGRLTVSLLDIQKVKEILQSNFCAFLKVEHNGLATYVTQVCSADCERKTCEYSPYALIFKLEATGEYQNV